MANNELLEQTMAFIEANPDKHDQSNWKNECGTAFCFAGHAAILAGAKLPTNVLDDYEWGVTPDGESVAYDYEGDMPEGTLLVEDYARDALGLHDRQADALFNGGNERGELRAMVDALKADPEANLWSVRHAYYNPDEAEETS